MSAVPWAYFADECVLSSDFLTALFPLFPDLNLCDSGLWVILKDRAYRGNIQTVPELKESIPHHVSSTDRETFRAIVEHAVTRFEHMINANGMHIEEICNYINFLLQISSTSAIFSPGGQNLN